MTGRSPGRAALGGGGGASEARVSPLERGFIEHLRDHPRDLDTHAVYADWLFERGDPRGELAAADLAALRARSRWKRRRLEEAARRARERYLAEVWDGRPGCAPVAWWIGHAAELVVWDASAASSSFGLSDGAGSLVRALELRRTAEVHDVLPWVARSQVRVLRFAKLFRACACQDLSTPVDELEFAPGALRRATPIAVILDAPRFVAGLRGITLSGNDLLGDAAVRHVVAASRRGHLDRLEWLDVAQCGLTDEAVAALAEAALPALARVDLSANHIQEARVEELSRALGLPHTPGTLLLERDLAPTRLARPTVKPPWYPYHLSIEARP